MSNKELFFSLLKCELQSNKIPSELKEELTTETIKWIYELSSRHDLCHLFSDLFIKEGILEKGSELFNLFFKVQASAIYRRERTDVEIKSLKTALNQLKVDYVLLKGSKIKEIYPETWMRTSGDVDVFIHKEDLEKTVEFLSEKCGYKYCKESYRDISLNSPMSVHVELHHSLINEGHVNTCTKVLRKVWDNSSNVIGTNEYVFNNEFLMFYNVAHMAKHFVNGGCGIKPFIDFYFLEKKLEIDEDKIKEMLNVGGLYEFYCKVKEIVNVWFGDGTETETTRQIETYVLNGGVYGNFENESKIKKVGGEKASGYIGKTLFLPYKNMCMIYPVLKKAKILLPLFWVIRFFKMLFKGRLKKYFLNVKKINSVSDEEVKSTEKMLKDIGLK